MVQTESGVDMSVLPPCIKTDEEGRRLRVHRAMLRVEAKADKDLLLCIHPGEGMDPLPGTITSDRMLKQAIRLAYSYFPWMKQAIGNQNDHLDKGKSIRKGIIYVLGICEDLRWNHRDD